MSRSLLLIERPFSRIPAPVWVVVLSVPALTPLAWAGAQASFFDSHDGLFHAYRLAALTELVRDGVLYPRWLPEFAFGYGYPVFNFYSPLSYYAGLPFTLVGADPFLALRLVLALGLVGSALGAYLFARLYLSRLGAIVVAVTYAYLPYHLIDLYVRGAVAEFLAFVWFPLSLWAFDRLIRRGGLARAVRAAACLAALVLTHNLSALLFAPVLAAYAGWMLWRHRAPRSVMNTLLASGLAVVLSGFYWVPVLAESQYVGLASGASAGYRDHLLRPGELLSLSATYPYPQEVPGQSPRFPVGWVQLGLLGAGTVAALRRQETRRVGLLFAGVGLLSGFMLTTSSLPIWRLVEPVLAYLQYPWRFHALLVLATAFLAGTLVPARATRQGVAGAMGVIVLVAVWAAWNARAVPLADASALTEAMWATDYANEQIGATWTAEYLPVWVQEERWAIPRSTSSLASGPTLPSGELGLLAVAPTHYRLQASLSRPTRLVLHQFHFPGWVARWQGGTLSSQPAGRLGLATFALQPGSGELVIELIPTGPQRLGAWLSTLAALACCAALLAQRWLAGRQGGQPTLQPGVPVAGSSDPRPVRGPRRALGLAVPLVGLAGLLLAGLFRPGGCPARVDAAYANLENRVELLGYTTGGDTYRPGDTLPVTLFWRGLAPLGEDYKAFVHLTDAALTRQVAQQDGAPGGGYSPTSRWLPGELVPDRHSLTLPPDLAPGMYTLWAGMYAYPEVRNLTVLSSAQPAPDNRVRLGDVEVRSP